MKKVNQPSSVDLRIAARKNPRFEPTGDQIETAGKAARSAYQAAQHVGEVTRWECAAEAALRTLSAVESPVLETAHSDG